MIVCFFSGTIPPKVPPPEGFGISGGYTEFVVKETVLKSLKILTLFAVVMMSFGLAYAGECGTGCTATCCEDTDITVYGSARYRLDIDGKSFAADANMDWTQFMRSRLGVKASRGNSGMVFEVQDSRILGEDPGMLAGEFTNGGHDLNFDFDEYGMPMISMSQNDFGVRQAYLWHKPCDKGAIQVGRFGVSLHNERLIGQVGWHNIGRTTEGVLFKRSITDDITFIGSALQVMELNADDADGKNIMDPMFFVADVNFAEMGFDLFLYLLKNGNATDDNHKLMTFGAYSKRTFGSNMFYDAMFAMQSGSYDVAPATKSTTADVSGMMVNLELGMKMESGTKVSALVDYTTGDDPTTATENEGFNNLLYTGHKWNGYMDYFLGGMDAGLMDIALRVAHPVTESMWVKVDAHMFATVEDYTKFGTVNEAATSIGNELDITVVKQSGNMTIQGGLSIFLANEDWKGADAEMAKWAYLQSSFGF